MEEQQNILYSYEDIRLILSTTVVIVQRPASVDSFCPILGVKINGTLQWTLDIVVTEKNIPPDRQDKNPFDTECFMYDELRGFFENNFDKPHQFGGDNSIEMVEAARVVFRIPDYEKINPGFVKAQNKGSPFSNQMLSLALGKTVTD